VLIKNRQKALVFAAIAVVGLFAADKLLITPLTSGWKSRSAQIVKLRQQINDGNQVLVREQSIRSRWTQMRTNALPNNNSVAEEQVLKAIDRWSQSSRLSINAIAPQWKRESDDYSTLECRVDATGTLETIKNFLFDIEKDPLGLRLDAVEVTARDKEGRQLALGVQISGLVLSLPEKQP
jgi:Tfp pilus assembly protein PilO